MITVKGHGMITVKGVRAGINPAPTNLPEPVLLTFAGVILLAFTYFEYQSDQPCRVYFA